MPATILQLSDTHLVADRHGQVNERSPDERLRAIVERRIADRANPIDLVILSGDLSEDGSPESYERIAAILEPLGADVFALAGNHDDAVNVAACFGETVTTALAGWSIVALETTRPGQVSGGVDMTDALERIDRCAGTSTVVVMHHPPVSLSTHQFFRFDGASQFVAELTERPHVRVVLSGHLHSPFDLGVEGLRLLGCPSTLYGISHHGATYTITRDDGIGARLIGLGDDGSVTTTLV